MKISYNWLKQFIKISLEAEKVAEVLTDLGLEVEGIHNYQTVPGGLKGVVVGHVLTCVQHPNADRLKITTVDVGNENILQIVCGAPNVAAGQKVPVATIGTILYDKEGNPFEIKKGKIRGEVSEGMICAEDELGLGSSHDGILILDAKLSPGTLASKVFSIEDDRVFEIGLTPNRADAMSHMGVARDLRAGLAQHEKIHELITPSISSFGVDNRVLKIDVEVNKKELAPRYCGVTLTEVKVKESPDWLKNRLKAIGITPKNNVVDVTNYVMHELGQPLHAFDAAKIKGNKIIVKTLPADTSFVTLDDVERKLHEDDLMICDVEKPLCIAGVFGGKGSGITDQTSSVFLESAYFDPVSIRKSAKRHGLNTDASFRFERGIDINITDYALKRAANLIKELAEAKISSDLVDVYPKKIEDHKVFLTFEKVNKLIGEKLPQDTIKKILSTLEIKVLSVTESGMGLSIPPYRVDVIREADVIEEILRVYGYNNIKFSDKLNASISHVGKFEDYKVQDKIANQLVSNGFYEMMTNSLSSPEYLKFDPSFDQSMAVQILNPLSTELSIMRTQLLYTGLESVAYNINRRKNNLKLFEFGKIYRKEATDFKEGKMLSMFITGNTGEENWANPKEPTHFYHLKGYVNFVLNSLGITDLNTIPATFDAFSEGISYVNSKNDSMASIGVVKPEIAKYFGIKQEIFYAFLNWNEVLASLSDRKIQFKEIPKFPEVRRDLALLLDKSVAFEKLYHMAFLQERKLLKKVDLFDVYDGKNLPDGKKSYALSFILQDENKTLEDNQIDKIMRKVQSAFEAEFGAVLR